MRRWSLRHERLLRSTLSATESEQQRGDGEAKSAGASHKMLAISTKAKSAGASRCRVSSTSSSEATARQRRLERHTRCLPSALAQPTRSKLPSSIEHGQQRGNGEAQAAGASRKTVAISTHSLEYEQYELLQQCDPLFLHGRRRCRRRCRRGRHGHAFATAHGRVRVR